MSNVRRRTFRESQRPPRVRVTARTPSRLEGRGVEGREPSPSLSIGSERSDCSARHLFGLERTRRMGPGDHRHPCACFACALCLCRDRCFPRVKHLLRRERPSHQGDPQLDEQRLSPWDARETQHMLAEECRASGGGICKVCGSSAWRFVRSGVHCFRCFSFQNREGYVSLRTPDNMLPTPKTKRKSSSSGVRTESVLLSSGKEEPRKEKTPQEEMAAARIAAAVTRAKPDYSLLEPEEYPEAPPDTSLVMMEGSHCDKDLLNFMAIKLDLKEFSVDNIKVLSKKAESWMEHHRPYWSMAKRNRMLKGTLAAFTATRKSTYGQLEEKILEHASVVQYGFKKTLLQRTVQSELDRSYISSMAVRNKIVRGMMPTLGISPMVYVFLVLSFLTVVVPGVPGFLLFVGTLVFACFGMAQMGWRCIFSLKWEDLLKNI